MNVEVWFHGKFEELATGKRTIELPEGVTLGDLIDRLTQEYGVELRQEIERPDENYIMLNGNYCELSANRGKPLQHGDIVAFVPILSGG